MGDGAGAGHTSSDSYVDIVQAVITGNLRIYADADYIGTIDNVVCKKITNAALTNGTVREIYLEGWKNT